MTAQVDSKSKSERTPPEAGSWIVGVDGSDCSRHALRWATEHAAGRATQMHLVTSWHVPIYGTAAPLGPVATAHDVDEFKNAATEQTTRLAAETRRLLDMPVDVIIAHGGASAVLLEASAHGELLVIGSRGRGGFSRLLLGSTSNQCATHACVPTVVIPARCEIRRSEHFVVGVDGSPNSIAALRWAVDFAPHGGTVTAVWVWDASPLAVGSEQFFFPEATDLARDRFEHVMDEVKQQTAASVGSKDLVVRREFVEGAPRTELLSAAERADVLVVGARGHGAIGAALLGSVSTWLLHHTEIPIAVVPDCDGD